MVDAGSDFWVCGGCRSVNNLRAKQCYNCRTPRERAAVDPTSIDPSTHGQLREIELPPYESPKLYGMFASALILAVAGMQVISTILSTMLVLRVLDGVEPTEADLIGVGLFSLLTLAVGALALIAWSAWLSKTVTAMPALGLGYPPGNGLTAFVENFLPGLNLLRVPAIVRDIVRRLSPDEGRGDALIFVAWIGLFGGFVVPRVGRWFGLFAADTFEATIRNELVVEAIAIVLVLVGAIFLVALIWWVQGRIDERREAQLAGDTAPAATTQGGDEATTSPTLGAPAAAGSATVATDPFDAARSAPLRDLDVPTDSPATVHPVTAAAAAPDDEADPADTSPLGSDAVSAAPTAPPAPVASQTAQATPTPQAAPPIQRPLTALAPRVADVVPERETGMAAPVPAAEAPAADGPRLTIRIVAGMVTGAIDDEPEEPLELDELRTAAPALARAGGSAAVVAGPDDADLAGRIVDVLRANGIVPDVRSL